MGRDPAHPNTLPARDGDVSATDLRQRDLQARLLRGDRRALDVVATDLLPILERRLRRAFRRVPDDAIHDAVTDAFMEYAQCPSHLASSSDEPPIRFLYRAAWRNVADARRSDFRRRSREARYARDTALQAAVVSHTEYDLGPDTDIIQRVLNVAIDDAEHRALMLWLKGERRTQSLGQALGLEFAEVVIQRREVKRFKDRILKRIARLMTVRSP